MNVLIVGAGGHGQVVADILLRAQASGGALAPLGYVDDAPHLQGQMRLGLAVLGTVQQIDRLPHDAVIVAIGDNATRRQVYDRLRKRGERLATAVHPCATIAPDVVIGQGSMICAGVIINTGAVVGSNVILNTACTIDHHNQIGDHVHIAPGSHLGGDVVVGPGALIGIGAVVTPQKHIAEWSIVGAGAVVIRDVPARATVAGVPARPVAARGKE